jgi:alcohol dehydrogenase
MHSLQVTGPGEVDWVEVPEPELADARGALVRPLTVATCDFDHLIVAGRAPVPYPVQIGHEVVGEVVAVGDDVAGVSPGDRVVVPFQISCGGCAQCGRGRTSCCEAVPWLSCYGLGLAAGDWGGAIADLLAVPYADAMLVPLPAGLAPAVAAAAGCNITDAYRCVAPQLAEMPGAPVLVAADGFQNIGLISVVLAAALGAERIDVVGLGAPAAGKAAELGARVLDSLDDVEPGAYPITVDASLNEEMLVAALRGTAPGGVCTISAMYPQPPDSFPLLELFAACATVQTGQPHVRGEIDDVLRLLEAGAVRTDLLVDETLPWESAAAAYAAGGGRKVAISRQEG